VQLAPNGNNFHLSFEKSKNAQLMYGNRVTVVAATFGPVCPLKLPEMTRRHTGRAMMLLCFGGSMEEWRRRARREHIRKTNILHMHCALRAYRYGSGA